MTSLSFLRNALSSIYLGLIGLGRSFVQLIQKISPENLIVDLELTFLELKKICIKAIDLEFYKNLKVAKVLYSKIKRIAFSLRSLHERVILGCLLKDEQAVSASGRRFDW